MPRKKKVEEPIEEEEVEGEVEEEVEGEVEEEVEEIKVVDENKDKYVGLIMIKKSPSFKHPKGNPLELEGDEVVAVDPNDRRVMHMLRSGNAQFVSNKVKGNPRIITSVEV